MLEDVVQCDEDGQGITNMLKYSLRGRKLERGCNNSTKYVCLKHSKSAVVNEKCLNIQHNSHMHYIILCIYMFFRM